MKRLTSLFIVLLGIFSWIPTAPGFAQCDEVDLVQDTSLQLPTPPPIPFEILDDLQAPEFQYGAWSELASYPAHRFAGAGIYDPVRDRLVLFGGSNFIPKNDLWVLDLAGPEPQWARLEASGLAPESRFGHTAVYDPLRDRMLVFGGQLPENLGVSGELWELTFSPEPTWNLLSIAGTPPQARANHACIYDPIRDRLVVFGGTDPAGLHMNDVWECTLSDTPEWQQLAPLGNPPEVRSYHAMVYDQAGDRAVVYGGYGAARYGDLWTLDLAGQPTWTRLTETGTVPDTRSAPSAVYDEVTDELIIFGGRTDLVRSNELLAVSLSGTIEWRTLALPDPGLDGRSGAVMVYDSSSESLVMHGGLGSSGYSLADAWEFPLRTDPGWGRLPPEMPLPHGRAAHSFTYDSIGDAYYMYGNDFTNEANAVWRMSIQTDPDGTEHEEWEMLPVPPVAPTVRGEHGAVLDDRRHRLIITTGTTSTSEGAAGLNDTWALELDGEPTWTLLDPGTGPSPRGGSAVAYDRLRDRLILFGGVEFDPYGNRIWKNDTWALNLGQATPTWEELTTVGALPPVRGDHMMIYDPVGDRVVVFGGSPIWGTVHGDCWALKFGPENRWEELHPLGASPAARSAAATIYDPIRDRMVISGGADPEPLNDTWALSFRADEPTWSLLSPVNDTLPPARGSGAMAGAYDSRRDRFVNYGGASYWHYRETSTWSLTWGLTADAADGPTILGVYPPQIAADGPVSVAVLGVGFETGSYPVLSQGGYEISPVSATMSPDGTVIFGNFNIDGLLPGSLDVVVVEPGNKSIPATDAIEVESEPRTNLDISMSGRNRFRPGTETVVNISFTNTGNVTVPSVPLFITGLPGNAEVRALSGMVELNPDASGIEDATGNALELYAANADSTDYGVCLQVANLSPALPVQVSLGITIPENVNLTLRAQYGSTVFWYNDTPPGTFPSEKNARDCVTAIVENAVTDVVGGFLPDYVNCGLAISEGITNATQSASNLVQESDGSALYFSLDFVKMGINAIGNAINVVDDCVGTLPPTPPVLLADAFFAGWSFGTTLSEDCGVSDALMEAAWSLTHEEFELEASASIDPNEIRGPSGVGPNRNIPPSASLSYEILFENLSAATAAAQVVVINDQLDLDLYDPATFSFGNISIGSRLVQVSPGRRSLNDVVDLQAEMGVYVLVQGSLNETTGMITWRFLTIDPATCGLPSDPEMGFLPPNQTSPEGEGSVRFTVRLRDGLSSGTPVRTGAEIIFDANPAILTGDWINVIDDMPPTSEVAPLAATQDETEFLVEWSGFDADGGIGGYFVYVSEDGGSFEVWQEATPLESAMFHGTPGKTYAFYSIAVDFMGNTEAAPGGPDASTTIIDSNVDVYIQDTTMFFDTEDEAGTPYIGMDLNIGVNLMNSGEVEATAQVLFEFDNGDGTRTVIDNLQVVIPPTPDPAAAVWAEVTWTISTVNTTIFCSVIDVVPNDVDPSNNFVSRVLTEDVVGTFITELSIAEDEGDITLSWTVRNVVADDVFLLTATQDGRSYDLPIRPMGSGVFQGLDEMKNRPTDDPVKYSLFYQDEDGSASLLLEKTHTPEAVTLQTGLRTIHPNPFNPATTIQFALKRSQQVEVTVFDLAGRRVKTLVNKVFARGRHSVVWNGMNSSGQGAPSGIYMVRMRSRDGLDTRKIMLVR